MSSPGDTQDGGGEFGPGGYLPQRAAVRARKIVLREKMGIHWVIASVVAGVLILALTIPALLATQGAPSAPFVAVGPVSAIDARGGAVVEADGIEVLVIRGGGVLRAFLPGAAAAEFCETSGRLEDGETVWSLQGRLLRGETGDTSLASVPVTAYEDVLYVAPADAAEPLPAREREAEPGCA